MLRLFALLLFEFLGFSTPIRALRICVVAGGVYFARSKQKEGVFRRAADLHDLQLPHVIGHLPPFFSVPVLVFGFEGAHVQCFYVGVDGVFAVEIVFLLFEKPIILYAERFDFVFLVEINLLILCIHYDLRRRLLHE